MLYDYILTTTDVHFNQLEILFTVHYRYPFLYHLSLLSLSIRKRNKVTLSFRGNHPWKKKTGQLAYFELYFTNYESY